MSEPCRAARQLHAGKTGSVGLHVVGLMLAAWTSQPIYSARRWTQEQGCLPTRMLPILSMFAAVLYRRSWTRER